MRVVMLCVAALFVGSACGDDEPPPASTSSDTPSAIARTVTPSPATPVCRGEAPSRSDDAVGVDVDGNATPDRMLVSAPGGDGYQLQLVIDEASAFSSEILPGIPDVTRAIGGYDVDGDGRDELFVATGNGAYTTWIDVYEFVLPDCRLVRLATPGADPPQFLVGASVGNGSGLRCADGRFISTSFHRTSDDPLAYAGTVTTLAIDGGELRVVDEIVVAPVAADAPPQSSFQCGALSLSSGP